MAQQFIDTGNTANDGTGTPLRDAFEICNENFSELYNIGGISGIANGTSNIQVILDSTITMSSANVPNVVQVAPTGLTVQGTILGNAIVSATGNVSAGGFFIGNGSLLTGVVSQSDADLLIGNVLSANVTTSTLTAVGTLANLSVAGNVTGANLATPGVITASGNVTALNFNATGGVSAAGAVLAANANVTNDVNAGGQISAIGNVLGNFFIGNGSLLTGVSVSSNAALLTGTTLSSNVINSGLRSLGDLDSLVVSNALGGTGNVEANNVILSSGVTAVGNITGSNLISTDQMVTVSLSATANITGGNLRSNGEAVAIGNITGANIDTAGLITATGNITGGNINTAGLITATGNVTGANINTAGLITATGNITGGNLVTGGVITATGNITGGNINTAGLVSASGNIRGNSITATGNVTGQNFIGNVVGNISGSLSAPGSDTQVIFNDVGIANATSGFTFDKSLNAVSVTGNITGGNLTTAGIMSVSGNTILGGNVFASGGNTFINSATVVLTDPIPAFGRGANNSSLGSDDGKDRGVQLYYFETAERSAFIGYDNSIDKLVAALAVNITNEVVTVTNFGNILLGNIESQSAVISGNVTAGNINTAGLVSAGGNITGANVITSGTVSASGNVTGGNVTTAGIITATGNITGGNVTTAGSITASGLVTASGNVRGGNVTTAGQMSATGNITGGNITTAGATQTASLSVTGNTATVTTANYTIGYRDLPQIGTLAQLTASDGHKHFYGSGTITIPANSTVPLSIGTTILVVATGTVTIAHAVGVTLRLAGAGSTGFRSLGANGMATLIKVDTNIWYINGTGIT